MRWVKIKDTYSKYFFGPFFGQKHCLFYIWQLRKRHHFWCSLKKYLDLLIFSPLYMLPPYLIISFRSPWFKYSSLFFVVKNFFAIVLSISEFSSCCFNEVTLFLDDLVSLLFSWAFVFGYDNCRNYGFFYSFGYFNNFWFIKRFCYFISFLCLNCHFLVKLCWKILQGWLQI